MDEANETTIALLRKAGLTESQAKGYLALIKNGQLTPVELAELTNESRTNGYMICEKLEKLGLATKKDGKKVTYTPTHPSALEALAERRRKAVQRNELDVKQNIDPLINLFYAATEMPGARTLQGIDGIKEVYDATLRTKQDIYLIRSTSDVLDLGRDYLNDYRKQRASLGINTFALTPVTTIAQQHVTSGEDAKMLFHRTWLPTDAYSAPVEIDVFGSKVAFITFGETQMATIIDSGPIAEAMRQIMQLLADQLAPEQQT
ncbi:hypothetical protein EOL96_04985 [Candidatus Saccharibacteria bacterium]|nr:hypothetical protein [Candidatus Saccharibacteria bacterium]